MTSKPTRWEQGAFIHSRQSATWSSEYVAECVEREKKMVFCAGQPVAKFMNPEDARRTVACVNACNGLPTNALEGLVAKGGRLEGADWYVEMMDRQLEQAEDQRDELLAALEPFARLNSSEDTIRIEVSTADVARARAAIAKVKGGSA